MKKILLSALAALLLASCLPKDTRIPQSPLLPFLERKSGLIVYIGIDGNIYVSDQSGRSPQVITDDAILPKDQNSDFHFYEYPTWSADGTQVAFVSAAGNSGSPTTSKIFVRNIEDDSATKIYESETQHPIYLYWSPDNEHVSFLSTSAAGQSLLLQRAPVTKGERVILDAGAPYYWSWAPDGSTMIVHTGSDASATPNHLAFLQVDKGLVEDGLDSYPASFQAPAWSPDGSQILFTRISDKNKNEIVLADSTGQVKKPVAEFNLNTAFAWSPDSSLVAYIDGEQSINAGVIGKLHVMDLTTSEDFFQADDIFAFFWSPNSRKLAYFKPLLTNGSDSSGQQQLLLQLNMLDVVSGESKELFTFQPTSQFSSILPYFDQYHQSATIWSPDSNNLLLAFLDKDGNPGIAIAAASGQLEPRLLANGLVGFWSWK